MMPTPDLALSFRKITRLGSTRIVESAFALARREGRKVTAVHKANVLRVSDGLFLECARQVAANIPTSPMRKKSSTPWRRSGARREPVRRHRHHQYVRRHPLRPGLRIVRQHRARGLAQCRRHLRRGAGAARLGAGNRRQGSGQSVIADRLGRHAARLARPETGKDDYGAPQPRSKRRSTLPSLRPPSARAISAARSAPRRLRMR